MSSTLARTCSTCRTEKPASEFYNRASSCKECLYEKNRARQDADLARAEARGGKVTRRPTQRGFNTRRSPT